MIPEEVLNEIKQMGYVLATPRRLSPSYYKLNDGTILRAMITVNYLLPDPLQTQGFTIISSNNISAFVPQEKRRLNVPVPLNTGQIVDDDVEFEVLQENFSVYDLSNDFILSASASKKLMS